MEAITASSLPLGPHQPQVPAASAGLVNYSTGQPWGDAHVAGWAAEPLRLSILKLIPPWGLVPPEPCSALSGGLHAHVGAPTSFEPLS